MTREELILDMVRKTVPPALAEVFPAERMPFGVCILATSVGIRVLDYFQIDARPIACTLFIGNRPWTEHLDRSDFDGFPPADDPWWTTSGAHGLVVGHPSDKRRNAWAGHLVAIAGEKIIDLDLGRHSRPHKGILLEAEVLPIPPVDPFGDPDCILEFRHPNGCSLHYAFRPDETAWRHAPDWLRMNGPKNKLIGSLIREIKANLAKEPRIVS